MLKQRVMTALILISLVIWSIVQLSSSMLAVVIGLFVIVGAWEWAGIVGWQTPLSRYLYALGIGLMLFLMYELMQFFPISSTYLLELACGWWLIALYWVLRYQHGHNLPAFTAWVKALLGMLILLPGWSALLILHAHQPNGQQWVIFLLILIWVADTAAYFSGRRWGKTKLADKISPGKTSEGVIGALLASLVIALGYAWLTAMTLSTLVMFVALCLLTVMASILGDLSESLFKRQAGLKDSSQLLPGHGGVLDRVDSLTAAAPIFVMGLLGMGKTF